MVIIMDLLEKINSCSDEELKSIVDNALSTSINNAKKVDRLGFSDNGFVTMRIEPYEGFISPDSKIKYSNLTLNTYSMKTTDYIYDFVKQLKKYKINNKNSLVNFVEYFVNAYFGIPSRKDMRDAYFDQITFQSTTTDDEYFEKLDNLEIGDLKGISVAMCTERAAVVQNLLSLFGFNIFYCMGCVNINGKAEPHCFNIALSSNAYILLDYSLPVSVFENGQVIDFFPFKAKIEFDEIEDILYNGLNAKFSVYEYIKTADDIKKVDTGEFRTYCVGNITFEQEQSKKLCMSYF